MAFNFFKKKEELNYPEEKASVLDQPFGSGMGMAPPSDLSPDMSMNRLPPLPEEIQMPQSTGNFREGFVPFEKMAHHELPNYPPMESSMSASLRSPEEDMTGSGNESLFKSIPKQSFSLDKPHVFVRINKYKEVMDSVNELHRRIQDAKKDLDDIHLINSNESSKLKEAAEVILKIEDILRYLETTFSSPEA